MRTCSARCEGEQAEVHEQDTHAIMQAEHARACARGRAERTLDVAGLAAEHGHGKKSELRDHARRVVSKATSTAEIARSGGRGTLSRHHKRGSDRRVRRSRCKLWVTRLPHRARVVGSAAPRGGGLGPGPGTAHRCCSHPVRPTGSALRAVAFPRLPHRSLIQSAPRRTRPRRAQPGAGPHTPALRLP